MSAKIKKNFNLPADIVRRLNRLSVLTGLTATSITLLALIEYLKEAEAAEAENPLMDVPLADWPLVFGDRPLDNKKGGNDS